MVLRSSGYGTVQYILTVQSVERWSSTILRPYTEYGVRYGCSHRWWDVSTIRRYVFTVHANRG
jgi:hypothetical protein